MNVNLLTDQSLKKLQSEFSNNRQLYQLDQFPPDAFSTFATSEGIESFDAYPVLKDKGEDEEQWLSDYNNGIVLTEFLRNHSFPISLITDERLIAYLTHVVYFDYMKKRWPVDDKHVNRIKERYLFNKFPLSRNGILRLCWPAILTGDTSDKPDDPYYFTRVAFQYSGTVDKLLERKFSRNRDVLKACLQAIISLPDPKEVINKNRSGMLGKRLNNVLSVISLDTLDYNEILAIVQKAVKEILVGPGTVDPDEQKQDDD